jgi:acyl-CoA thioesterase-1
MNSSDYAESNRKKAALSVGYSPNRFRRIGCMVCLTDLAEREKVSSGPRITQRQLSVIDPGFVVGRDCEYPREMTGLFLFRIWKTIRGCAGRGKIFPMFVEGLAVLFAVSCATQHPTLAKVTPADSRVYLGNVCDELSKPWPKNRTINIVCHGHSVPAGYFKTPEVRTFEAYPTLMHQQLCRRFPHAVINVIVTAIGGENSESGALRFERDVLSLRPDVVTIDYALNDRSIGLRRSEKAWRTMIEMALARHVKILLLTPTPDLRAQLDNPRDPLNEHAEQIRRLARDYGVGLVDSLARFQEMVHSGGLLADYMAQGNHPNRRGHEIVVEELLKWFPGPH